MTYKIINGLVYGTETTASGTTATICIGNEKQYRQVFQSSTSSTADYVTTTTTTTVYQWQKWDTANNAYADDTTNTDTILGVTPTSGAATVVTTSTTTDTMGKIQGNIANMQVIMLIYDAYIGGSAT
jgi:hypothetical protein